MEDLSLMTNGLTIFKKMHVPGWGKISVWNDFVGDGSYA